MNGFGPHLGLTLADCIRNNSSLQELNINANRLNTSNAIAIGQALLTNDTLKILRVDTCRTLLAIRVVLDRSTRIKSMPMAFSLSFSASESISKVQYAKSILPYVDVRCLRTNGLFCLAYGGDARDREALQEHRQVEGRPVSVSHRQRDSE